MAGSAPHRAALLLSPAGGPEAAYAALQYGADAVYCGLREFSARSEAVNFTPDELSRLCWHAHGRERRRAVFVALNTLAHEDELPRFAESVLVARDAGADALIVQDLGVAALARELAPDLELHASTQLCVHNAAGARAAMRLGFAQVTLARELSFAEIRAIAAAGVRAEVFIHGALCHSYSGLCLMSAMRGGGSGNRGSCPYPCRALWAAPGAAPALPFSMKDLALGPLARELSEAGVACLKIEGRMKSPLYVAAVTDFYRRILDGAFESEAEMYAAFDDTRVAFSRAQTIWNFHSSAPRDAVDPARTGHRGAFLGVARRARRGVAFHAERALEVRDGVQIEFPGEREARGFSISRLFRADDLRRPVFETRAGECVAIEIPPDFPRIPDGAPLFHASSQTLKRKFAVRIPSDAELKPRRAVSLSLRVSADGAELCARSSSAAAEARIAAAFAPACDALKNKEALLSALLKLGGTDFYAETAEVENPAALFIPVSQINAMRRAALEDLARAEAEAPARARGAVSTLPRAQVSTPPPGSADSGADFISIFADSLSSIPLDSDFDELIIDIGAVSDIEFSRMDFPRARIRLALPVIARGAEEDALARRAHALYAKGFTRWQGGNLAAFSILPPGADIAADWPLYAWNARAAARLADLGCSSYTLSPELPPERMERVLRRRPDGATVVLWQDAPLMISEACALSAFQGCGGCAGRGALIPRKGAGVLVCSRACRSTVVDAEPLDLTPRAAALRAAGCRRWRFDFRFKEYSAAEAAAVLSRFRRAAV